MPVILQKSTSPYTKAAGTTFRKEILPFGNYRHPNPDLWDNVAANWKFGKADAEQVLANFKAGAVDSVKFIGNHDEETAPILGEIKDLIITDHGMDAIIDVGDEKLAASIAKDRVLAPGVSVGLDPEHPNGNAGKDLFWPGEVLRHVAATPVPWITGMRDWESIAASKPLTKMEFGKGYKGDPLVPVKELRMTTAQRARFKSLAKSMKKTEADLAEELGLDITVDKNDRKKTDPDVARMLKAMSKVFGNAPDNDDDDDDDEDDDDDDEDTKPPKRASKKSKIRASKKSKQDDDDDDEDEDDVSDYNKTLKAALDPVAETIVGLSKKLNAGVDAVAKMEADAKQRDATEHVDALIKAGKVLPASKIQYEALYTTDPKLFGEITASMPTLVEFGKKGNEDVPVGDYEYNNPDGSKMSKPQVEENVSRYIKDLTKIHRNSAGMQDMITKKGA